MHRHRDRVSWPPVARLVRGEVLTLRDARIRAGRRRGSASATPRIIFGQVLPNALSPLIVTGSLMVANAILIESALSFLGLGDPNLMSWGLHDRRRPRRSARCLVDQLLSGARHPARPCWRSTSSAKGSTTRSTRGCAETLMSDAAPLASRT